MRLKVLLAITLATLFSLNFSAVQAATVIADAGILTYTMTAFVIGLIRETSVIAYVGDPLSLSQSGGNSQLPGSTLTVSGGGMLTVTVPAAVWLFATGLIGIMGLRRRQNRWRAEWLQQA